MTAPTLATRLRQLETMLLIRAFEEQLVELQRNGAPGTCTSVGEEACAVGVIDALESRDRILTNHRSAAHLLARGADPQRLIAEVLGRVDGYCSGRRCWRQSAMPWRALRAQGLSGSSSRYRCHCTAASS